MMKNKRISIWIVDKCINILIPSTPISYAINLTFLRNWLTPIEIKKSTQIPIPRYNVMYLFQRSLSNGIVLETELLFGILHHFKDLRPSHVSRSCLVVDKSTVSVD